MMTTQYASLRKDHQADQHSLVISSMLTTQYASLHKDHLAGDQQSCDHTVKKGKKISLIIKEIQKDRVQSHIYIWPRAS